MAAPTTLDPKTLDTIQEQVGQTLAGVRQVTLTVDNLKAMEPRLAAAESRLARFELEHGSDPTADHQIRAHRAAWGLAQRSTGKTGYGLSLHDMMKALTGMQGDGWSRANVNPRWADEFRADPLAFRSRELAAGKQRAANMSAGINTEGGYFVGEEWATEIIEALRPADVMARIGVSQMTVPPGTGQVHMGREDTAPTGYWVAEGVAPTSTGVTAGDVVASPKFGAILIKVTEQLLRYSAPSIEAMLRRVIGRELGLLKALAFFRGTGSAGQPTGLNILDSVDTTTAAIGANGGAITYEALRILERAYLAANARGENVAFVMHSNLQNRIARLLDSQNRPLLVSPDYAPGLAGPMPRTLFGYPVHIFNSLPVNLTKGSSGATLTECFLGDFSYAEEVTWSQLEMRESKEASDGTDHSFVQNLRFFLGIFQMDWTVTQPAAFASIPDATA